MVTLGSLTLRRLVMAIKTHHTIFLYLCPVFYIFPFGSGQILCHTEGGGCTWRLKLVTIGWVGTDTDHPSPDTGGDQCLSTVSTLPRVFSDCYQGSLEPFTIYFLPNSSVSLKTVQFPWGAVSATCWLCAVSLCLCKCQVPTIRAQLQCDSSPMRFAWNSSNMCISVLHRTL